MKFGELKKVINRNPGRHEWVAINIELGTDAIISAESPILDLIDDYEVAWICPSTVGKNLVTDEEQPCIEVHLRETKKAETLGEEEDDE